jgi:hypothetical protein
LKTFYHLLLLLSVGVGVGVGVGVAPEQKRVSGAAI